jgi:hypothetical protein
MSSTSPKEPNVKLESTLKGLSPKTLTVEDIRPKMVPLIQKGLEQKIEQDIKKVVESAAGKEKSSSLKEVLGRLWLVIGEDVIALKKKIALWALYEEELGGRLPRWIPKWLIKRIIQWKT